MVWEVWEKVLCVRCHCHPHTALKSCRARDAVLLVGKVGNGDSLSCVVLCVVLCCVMLCEIK